MSEWLFVVLTVCLFVFVNIVYAASGDTNDVCLSVGRCSSVAGGRLY